jgi:hypothetical protein
MTMRRILLGAAVAMNIALCACEQKPAPAPAPDAAKKYGGQYIDEAKKAAETIKATEKNVDEGVRNSGGNAD